MPRDAIVKYLKFIISCENPRIEFHPTMLVEQRNYHLYGTKDGRYMSVSLEAILRELERSK